MKILLLNEMMNSGSVSYYIREQTAIELSQKGHAVTMISPSLKSPSFGTSFIKNDVKYVFSPSLLPAKYRRGGFGILDLLTKLYYIITNKFNIIHTTSGHRPSQFIPSVASQKIKKSKIIDEWWEWYDKEGRAGTRNSFIGRLIGKYDDLFELRLKKYYDHIISISSFLQKRLTDNGFPKKKLTVLYGAINSEKFISYSINEARKKTGISPDDIIIGLIAVGELDHEDNTLFIESFLILSEKYPRLRLFVTGEKKYILKTFGQLIGTKVIYKGWLNIESYNLYLSSCNYFALPLNPVPRNLGRWPHKFSEFVFMERPIITNLLGDQAELVRKYKIGHCLDYNSEVFKTSLDEILSAKVMIDVNGFKILKNELTIKKRVERMNDIYSQF